MNYRSIGVKAWSWALSTTVVIFSLSIGSEVALSQEDTVKAGSAAFEADFSVVSFPPGVVALYFDTSESGNLMSSLPEWRFLGGLKIDSVETFASSYPTVISPLSSASQVEGLTITSASLQTVLERANVLCLRRSVRHSVPNDTLVWNEAHSEWRRVPDLSRHYMISFHDSLSVDSVITWLSVVTELDSYNPVPVAIDDGDIGYPAIAASPEVTCVTGISPFYPDDDSIYHWNTVSNDTTWYFRSPSEQWGGLGMFCTWGLLSSSSVGGIHIGLVDAKAGGFPNSHEDLNGQVEDHSITNEFNNHATNVAGIAVAAANNGVGVAGIAYDGYVELIETYSITESIDIARINGARVLMLPWHVFSYSQDLYDVLEWCKADGVITVAAAGNITSSSGNLPGIWYPGSWDELCITVGNLLSNGYIAPSSNYGCETCTFVDVAAPGTGLRTTNTNSLGVPGYQLMSGTSATTGIVGGLVALVKAFDDQLELNDVESSITATADASYLNLSLPLMRAKYGAGRVDGYSFVSSCVGDIACCAGQVGDVNGTGGDEPTIGDISCLIDYLFIHYVTSFECFGEADINQDMVISIADVSVLIDNLFISGKPLNACL
jgi:subtilisin family serine protease